MKILVIDIGGTNIKLKLGDSDEVRKFPSGPELTPTTLMEGVKNVAGDWQFDAMSLSMDLKGETLELESVRGTLLP